MNFELCCLASILGRSWRKGTTSRQASKVSRLWIVVKRKCLKMKRGWKQPSKQLEAGLGYRNRTNFAPSAAGHQYDFVVQSTSQFMKTQGAASSVFTQLGLEPNHTGLTAQSLFFLEELSRVKRSDTQTFSNYSNKFIWFVKRTKNLQTPTNSYKLLPSIKFTSSS